MLNFSMIEEARKLTEKRDEDQAQKAADAYQEALGFIRDFQQSKEQSELTEAAEKLFESIRYKRKQVEPYVWLAYIFHVMGKQQLAVKYLKIGEVFDPEYPKIKELKKLFEKSYARSIASYSSPDKPVDIAAVGERIGQGMPSMSFRDQLKMLVRVGIDQVNVKARVENETLRKLKRY